MDVKNMTVGMWEQTLSEVFSRISENERCKSIIADIGRVQFQLEIVDRPDFSYWEEYLGDRIVPHLGVAPDPAVIASTTLQAFVDTLLQRISIMEAAADEVWELRGDTETLMRCANLLPYVMSAFSLVISSPRDPARSVCE